MEWKVRRPSNGDTRIVTRFLIFPKMLNYDYKYNKLKWLCVAKIQQRYNHTIYEYRDWETDRKSTRLNSSHRSLSRMPSSA